MSRSPSQCSQGPAGYNMCVRVLGQRHPAQGCWCHHRFKEEPLFPSSLTWLPLAFTAPRIISYNLGFPLPPKHKLEKGKKQPQDVPITEVCEYGGEPALGDGTGPEKKKNYHFFSIIKNVLYPNNFCWNNNAHNTMYWGNLSLCQIKLHRSISLAMRTIHFLVQQHSMAEAGAATVPKEAASLETKVILSEECPSPSRAWIWQALLERVEARCTPLWEPAFKAQCQGSGVSLLPSHLIWILLLSKCYCM